MIKTYCVVQNKFEELYIAVREKRPGRVEEEIKNESDYRYPYQRFFSYFTLDEIKKMSKLIDSLSPLNA